MTDSSNGFVLSATLHGFIVAALLLVSYAFQQEREPPKIFELVAGEGDFYDAKVAPAAGTPGGVTIDVPPPPDPEPVPVASPVIPAPASPVVPAAPASVAPDFEKQIRWEIIKAESAVKMKVAREKAAEKRRLAAEKKRLAEEARRRAAEEKKMTKAEFDAKNKAKARPAPAKAAPPRIAKIDAAGIAKGVIGGSTANQRGGAGGRALVSDNEDVLGAYFEMFKQRLKREFETPPGLSDNLVAVVRVQSNANGSLTGARIATSSGSADFDRAVLDAIRRTQMPPRPDGRSEAIEFPFTMRERD